MLTLDGRSGEGGGQILRTSQSLLAAQACGATVEGAELKSTSVSFVPSEVCAGDFVFSIGTAGSTTLVMQAILPPLLRAAGTSAVLLQGGTHNPFAPPVEFLRHYSVATLANLPVDIARRENAKIERSLSWPTGTGRIHQYMDSIGLGNVVSIYLEHEHVTEVGSPPATRLPI